MHTVHTHAQHDAIITSTMNTYASGLMSPRYRVGAEKAKPDKNTARSDSSSASDFTYGHSISFSSTSS